MVAERVVDHLEVVEVEEQHTDAGVVAPAARDRALKHLLEKGSVRQARELVVVGEERHFFLRGLAFRDVEDHALDQPRVAVIVVDREGLL